MKKVLLYNHGSSYNHGCEAILRTVSDIISEKYPDTEYTVASMTPEEDIECIDSENGRYKFVLMDKFCKLGFEKRRLIVGGMATLFGNIPAFDLFFGNTAKAAKEASLAISVGGDTYSYGKSLALAALDKNVRKRCKKTVLWGCSVNPEMLDPAENKQKIEDFRKFDLITARETVTYEALKNLGLDNVKYYPDPAFTLKTEVPKEPMFADDRDIVGINISPLVQEFGKENGITLKNYIKLVEMLLSQTDFNIALISHVLRETSNDTEAAKLLMSYFPGENRIKIFDKGNAMQMKGYISRCRFFVAARTHASIAAYSSCIPTLVVGYSVKAKGIAADIFGTDEGYVVPAQGLSDEETLLRAFRDMMKNEEKIREHLNSVMPEYIASAGKVGDEIVRLLEG